MSSALALVCVVALAAPLTAGADSEAQATVAPGLLDAAQANPDGTFRVIVQGDRSRQVAQSVEREAGEAAVERSFVTVPGVVTTLTGSQLVALAQSSDPLVITPDSPMTATDEPVDPQPPPAAPEAPTVSGDAEPGRVLTATPPAWTGDGEPSYSYQWQRCGDRLRSAAVLADSPVGYWRLGESEGEVAADLAGHGLHGRYVRAVSHGVTGVTGDSDTGVALDGAGAAVDVTGIGIEPFSAGFTLEAWVKVAAPQSGRGLISRWLPESGYIDRRGWDDVGGILLRLDEHGHYGLVAGRFEPSYVYTEAAPEVGAWEHVVGTWDGSVLRLYRDGAPIGSQPFDGSIGDPAVNLTIGAYAGGSDSLDGALDEVAVYDRALSRREVTGHYAGCRDIAGAAGVDYSPTADDLGHRLRVSVTASGVTVSALTPVVTARPPTVTSAPAILGTAEEAQTLTAAHGGWDGTQPVGFDHEWQRCETEGESCVAVGGATEAQYTLGPEDVGKRIRLRVTARNLGGESAAHSEPSAAVVAVPEPHPAFKQHWPYVAGVADLLTSPGGKAAQPPTIAIVDSGIDSARADFGGRVIEEVALATRAENSPGDGNGHGTAVASVAAGEAAGYTGAAPNANLVSIDVLDDDGVASTSDVIGAADWIYENHERLNIRVVNLSLHGTTVASIVSDPLDRAVEKLWLSGIVVVAAAGNYAVEGAESAIPFAPANDPFILTVGATDTRGSFTERDDVAAPWSAWGYTRDGFAKPELAAPGRYIAAAVSPSARLALQRPERIVEAGYLQLSGTSLSAPVVAGSAATILGVHPDWTPDQVKGALMLSAEPLPGAAERSAGVGALNAAGAAALTDPPNPNLALNQFLVPDSGGPTRVFDAARWSEVVQTDPTWANVAWGSVAWGSAAWSSVAWGSVAWGSVAWGSVAWGSVAWGSVAWGSHAENDVRPAGVYWTRRN